jgi:hypothetical protein
MNKLLPSQLSGFGRVVTGSVNDCSRSALESALKIYDPLLYTKWNTDKQGGKGCWEIRRAPERCSTIYQGTYEGHKLFTYEKKENDHVHHVLDAPILHYGLVERIRSMDMWKYKDFDAHLHNAAEEYQARERRKANEEMQYDLKQFKREWRELAARVQAGENPGAFIKGIKG